MIKIWTEAFWKPAPKGDGEGVASGAMAPAESFALHAPVIVMVAAIALIGLNAEHVMPLARLGGAQLIDTAAYVQAVLGARR
jgi:multicomponent Na+:H+ antiporter subunit D